MSRATELKSELQVLEAFRDTGRARILRSMLEYELRKEEFSHDHNFRRPS
mgnify:CR=1 FL=1|jgi:hypothetical protein